MSLNHSLHNDVAQMTIIDLTYPWWYSLLETSFPRNIITYIPWTEQNILWLVTKEFMANPYKIQIIELSSIQLNDIGWTLVGIQQYRHDVFRHSGPEHTFMIVCTLWTAQCNFEFGIKTLLACPYSMLTIDFNQLLGMGGISYRMIFLWYFP